MSTRAEARIRHELGAGERLLWSGQPRQGLRLGRGPDLGGVLGALFLLVIAGLALNGARDNLADDRPLANVLIPIVMAVTCFVGIAFLVFVEPRIRRRTFYGLTDRRALIVGGVFGRAVESLPLRDMTAVELIEHGDGLGGIYFKDFWRDDADGGHTPGFVLIEDARAVYDRIQQARSAVWASSA
jgi:hypothetical protein